LAASSPCRPVRADKPHTSAPFVAQSW
jgi:hypothetical protein